MRVEELRTPAKIAIQQDGEYWRVVSVLKWKAEAEVVEEQGAEEALTEELATEGHNF